MLSLINDSNSLQQGAAIPWGSRGPDPPLFVSVGVHMHMDPPLFLPTEVKVYISLYLAALYHLDHLETFSYITDGHWLNQSQTKII